MTPQSSGLSGLKAGQEGGPVSTWNQLWRGRRFEHPVGVGMSAFTVDHDQPEMVGGVMLQTIERRVYLDGRFLGGNADLDRFRRDVLAVAGRGAELEVVADVTSTG